jgi:hypothetical protein
MRLSHPYESFPVWSETPNHDDLSPAVQSMQSVQQKNTVHSVANSLVINRKRSMKFVIQGVSDTAQQKAQTAFQNNLHE